MQRCEDAKRRRNGDNDNYELRIKDEKAIGKLRVKNIG